MNELDSLLLTQRVLSLHVQRWMTLVLCCNESSDFDQMLKLHIVKNKPYSVLEQGTKPLMPTLTNKLKEDFHPLAK